MGIQTTSHNISNAGREDYSRQRLELSSADPLQMGRLTLGRGVSVDGVTRQVDNIVLQQLRESEANLAAYEISETTLNEIQSVIANEKSGMQPMVEGFYAAAADLSTDPSSSTKRTVLIEAGNSLAARANSIADKLDSTRNSVTQQASALAGETNNGLASLEKINQLLDQKQGGVIPPDILDQRDQILKELNQNLGLNAHENARGQITLYTDKGNVLLSPDSRQQLSVERNPLSNALQLNMRDSNGQVTDISDSVDKGRLGALVDLGNSVIKEVENGLGRSLYALADSVNQLQKDGVKPDGALGGNFFNLAAPKSVASAANTGTATVAIEIADLSKVSTQNYKLTRNAADWTVTRDDGSSVTGAGPVLSFDGMNITTGGAAASGDEFYIRPVGDVSKDLSVAIKYPEEIAASGALRSELDPDNAGTGRMTDVKVDDNSNLNLLNNVALQFNDPPSTYDIVNKDTGAVISAGQAYTAGTDISLNGWTTSILGQPQAGDRFFVENNANGQGDNAVALGISQLELKKPLNDGNSSVLQSLNDMGGSLASRAQTANLNRVAEQGVRDYLYQRQQSVSGVNLDEEAANMVRLQQAYQASAQIIRTSQEIFNALMQAM